MKLSFISGLGTLVALAFCSAMATAAPPDFAVQAELMCLDASQGDLVGFDHADEVAFVTVGDDADRTPAMVEGEYLFERMSETIAQLGAAIIPAALHGQEVGVSFDTRGSPTWV